MKLLQLLLSVVVDQVERADVSDHTLGLDPDILERRVACLVDGVVKGQFDGLEVVSGEGGFFESQLEEYAVYQPYEQGVLSEGDDAKSQQHERVYLEDAGQLDGPAVVARDEVANLLVEALADSKDREQNALGVRQNVEGGKQGEWEQGEQYVGSEEQEGECQQEVLGVVISQELNGL